MVAFALSAFPKRHWSRSLAPSTQSSQSMTHPLLRNASAYRNDPSHPPYPLQTWSTCHSACHPQPCSTTKSLGTARSEIVRECCSNPSYLMSLVECLRNMVFWR